MKQYLITSPDYYTQEPKEFEKKLSHGFESHKPDFALYRDKENKEYMVLARTFLEVCEKYGVKGFLHSNVALAKEFSAFGVHLTSTQFNEIVKAKESGLHCCISTHTKQEACLARELGADFITYSPIFPTPDKGEPKGVEALQELVQSCDIKVFALGGIITIGQRNALEAAETYGFASIRYFFS